jgi:hypothetical protein
MKRKLPVAEACCEGKAIANEQYRDFIRHPTMFFDPAEIVVPLPFRQLSNHPPRYFGKFPSQTEAEKCRPGAWWR